MGRDVGQYYLHHLHATAGSPELLLRAVEKALWSLRAGDVEAFTRRLNRIRRSLRLERGHGPLAAALVRSLIGASRDAREGDAAAAEARLQPLVSACLEARPRSATALA